MSLRNASDLTQRKTDQTKYFDHVRLRGLAAQGALGKVLTINDFISVVNGGVLQFDKGGNVVGCQTCSVVSSGSGGGGGGGGGGSIPIWAAAFYSGGVSGIFNMDKDSNDNVYITGFYDTATLSNAYIVNSNQSLTTSNLMALTSAGAMFMLKFNNNGIFQFALGLDGTAIVGNPSDTGTNIKIGTDGSIYIAGNYGGTSNNLKVYNSNFTSQTSNVLPTDRSGISSGFLVKYNSAGTFQYACAVSGLTRTIIDGLAIDSANNTYISGSYSGASSNLYFYNSNQSFITSNKVANLTDEGAYLVKFNSSGAFQYTCFASTYLISSPLVAIHPNNNITLMTNYTTCNTLPLSIVDSSGLNIPASVSLSSNVESSILINFSNTGTYLNNQSINSTGNMRANDIYIDQSDNTYITGQYSAVSSNIYIYSTFPSVVSSNVIPNSVLGAKSFAVKFNSSGVFDHATAIVNNGTTIISGNAITADSAGNYYVTGYYDGSNGSNNTYIVNRNNTSSNNNYLPTTSGISGAYVVKYNSSGICQFANALDSLNNTRYYDQGLGIVIDSQNNILVSGAYGDNNSNTQTSNNIFIYGSNQSSITRNILPSVVAGGSGGGNFILKFPN